MPVHFTRRLVVLTAMRWFPVGLVVPVLILLLGARGLPLNQVGQVMAVYGIVTLSLELPTGGLADAWGRRPVVVAAALLSAVGLAALAFVGQVPLIVLAVATLGAARALSSGPVESWFVDAMHEAGHFDIEAGLAKGGIAESLALGAGSVIGGLLPGLFSALPTAGPGLIALSVPFVAAAVMMVVFALIAAALVSDGSASGSASVAGTVMDATRHSMRHAPVRRVLLVALCLGLMLSGIELLAPNTFAGLLGGATQTSGLYGILTAAGFVTAAAGAALSTRLPGRRQWVAMGAYLVAAGLVMLVGVPLLGVAAVSFLLFYMMIGLQGPVMAGLLHDRVQARMRATMMSVESLMFQGGGALASLLVGALAAAAGLIAGLGVVAVTAVAAAGLLLIDRDEPTTDDDM
ncbi:MAG: MFS transporter [Actinobacteria bacterium]|nr:MFS transporter [Actinomycetota bacterium]MCB8996440.1 MFS transporter [Actinomycetota bacterium]